MCCPQCETKITYYFANRDADKQTFVCMTCGKQFSEHDESC